MVEPPPVALRRVPPDPVQLQVILGSLLGDGRLVGPPRGRRLRIAHRRDRADYIRWKYERLGPFAASPPRPTDGGLTFDTIAHPVFDDLAGFVRRAGGASQGRRAVVDRLLRPLGLAVWLADVGRLELRAESFLPAQREVALAG